MKGLRPAGREAEGGAKRSGYFREAQSSQTTSCWICSVFLLGGGLIGGRAGRRVGLAIAYPSSLGPQLRVATGLPRLGDAHQRVLVLDIESNRLAHQESLV